MCFINPFVPTIVPREVSVNETPSRTSFVPLDCVIHWENAKGKKKKEKKERKINFFILRFCVFAKKIISTTSSSGKVCLFPKLNDKNIFRLEVVKR